MADISIRSNQTVLSRCTRPESGRLHRKYPYRWLFDQVHVKSLIFHVEVGLLAFAMVGLYHTSVMHTAEYFDPPDIPGFDGYPVFSDFDRSIRKRPQENASKSILNFFSYFLIFSVIFGFFGMRLSETSVTRRNFPPDLNPASLLIPSAISVIAFLYPLSVWTFRTFHKTLNILTTKDNLKLYTLFDSLRLTFLPIIIIWVAYFYLLYGFWLGFLYYQRRGDQTTPTSHNSPFRRQHRKQSAPLRFQGKASSNNSPVELSAVALEPSSSCAAATPSRHNRSVSPRGFRHLETVDEEAQSRTSSD